MVGHLCDHSGPCAGLPLPRLQDVMRTTHPSPLPSNFGNIAGHRGPQRGSHAPIHRRSLLEFARLLTPPCIAKEGGAAPALYNWLTWACT